MLSILKFNKELVNSIDVNNFVEKSFLPGMVLSYCTGSLDKFSFSNGVKSIGVIDDIRDGDFDSTIGSKRLTFWPLENLKSIKTDQFIFHSNQNINNDVYVFRGKFSTVKNNDKIGKLIEINDDNVVIEFC